MFMSSLQNALLFSIYTIFNTYIIIVLFRFMLQAVGAETRSPLAQFAARVTNPLLVPLQKIIPKYKRINIAALVLALLLETLQILIVLYIQGFSIEINGGSISGLFVWGFGELLDLFLVFILFTTIIQVILSWVQPSTYNPNAMLFERVTAPFINPIRNILPDFGVLDFSPLVLIFLIYLCRMVIASTVVSLGRSMI